MPNLISSILLIFAGFCLGGAFTRYQNEKTREKWEADVFSIYIKKLIEVQSNERERYDAELAKLKKLHIDRVLCTTGPVRDELERRLRINPELKVDSNWAKIPDISKIQCDDLHIAMNEFIAKLKTDAALNGRNIGDDQIVFSPPFYAPDGTIKWGAAVIPKEED